MNCRIFLLLLLLTLIAGETLAKTPKNLRDDNLIAWCIVPFDSKERTPEQRAEMVRKLGLRRVAYDWRDKHVPEFEDEILQYKKHGIEFFAFWGTHPEAFKLFEKYDLHPQIWQTLGSPAEGTPEQRVQAAAESLLPLVEQTRKAGCQFGLYNHGGWGGEPENMVAVCRYLREQHKADHVGIVYNQHHGHGHIDNFAAALEQMKPYLLCLNLNGMTRDGDQRGLKILPIGEGELDLKLLTIIAQSGYIGPIGIIGHTGDDVEQRLQDNLDGLHWLLPQLDGKPAGPKPKLRTYSPETATPPPAQNGQGTLLEGKPEYRRPPITVECRATLPDARGYNILVASDTKQSGDHWEIFSMNGSGLFTAYLPGLKPDHINSQAMICDGKPHTLTMIYEPARIRLLVDGKVVADQAVESLGRAGVPAKLGIGTLVEGGIGCRGPVDWVRISRGVREIPGEPVTEPKQDDVTLLLWKREVQPNPARNSSHHEHSAPAVPAGFKTPEFSPQIVSALVERARREGEPQRGLLAFTNVKTACLSCHRIGPHGGSVGPELTAIGKQRTPEQLVEAVLWPKREVKPEFIAHMVIDGDGLTHQGYILRQDERELVLRDPTKPQRGELIFPRDGIEFQREVGTLMPDNLAGALSAADLNHLLQFLFTLGTAEGMDTGVMQSLLAHAQAHAHGPATFPLDRKPLEPARWPLWQQHVNRDRVYDFYAKQADFFRTQPMVPPLLGEFPGLDGGVRGHWGNQDDALWRDDRWNSTQLGSVIGGIFRSGDTTVPRGICVRLGERDGLAVCFNPDTLRYEAVWTGGFVQFAPQRHGFLSGLQPAGTLLPVPEQSPVTQPFQYRGFYRHGNQVLFAYRVGDQELLDAPVMENGQLKQLVAPVDAHPLRHLLQDAPPQWPQKLETTIHHGQEKPYALDTIELPFANPWKALLFCGGHAFLPDGTALVCTMQGDVWQVSGLAYPSRVAKWRRFASGLHHPLGIVADHDGIFVLGRDQITRLHDLNRDGEADFYECFCNAYETSPAGHDFICGLERDAAGNFYTASGNQGLLRISPDGRQATVIAIGFRNPDGLGLLPDGTVTVPCSEGEWTPASMICAARPRQRNTIPHFGYGGPREGRVPELPLAYLPRALDNSSGGQVYVDSDQWGPLSRQLLHFSFGMGTHFLVLRDEVQGQVQGAVVPLPGEFRSGVHRGRFNPVDGQLYVTGMQGWASYTVDDGCFQRLRYTGGNESLPTGFHVHENGIRLTFSQPLDAATASVAANHFAQCWNYRYGPGYGSPEFSTRHPGMRGHDTLAIRSAHLSPDARSLFLELPDLQPVNQLHLRVQSAPGKFHELFLTVHRLDESFTALPGYLPARKTVQPHPILADLALATRSVPNPWRKELKPARPLTLETGTNLSYATRSLQVRAGEMIALTLSNPDVVPHNWALLKPGTLDRVGELADRSISDPEAALRHYIPNTTDVLAYTDVVLSREKCTIYFRAPEQPGRYPFLCTFPGHWKIMNGVMIVE